MINRTSLSSKYHRPIITTLSSRFNSSSDFSSLFGRTNVFHLPTVSLQGRKPSGNTRLGNTKVGRSLNESIWSKFKQLCNCNVPLPQHDRCLACQKSALTWIVSPALTQWFLSLFTHPSNIWKNPHDVPKNEAQRSPVNSSVYRQIGPQIPQKYLALPLHDFFEAL